MGCGSSTPAQPLPPATAPAPAPSPPAETPAAAPPAPAPETKENMADMPVPQNREPKPRKRLGRNQRTSFVTFPTEVTGALKEYCPKCSDDPEVNTAFMFIKPHADTPQVRELVVKKLEEYGIKIIAEGKINNKQMAPLIDRHYSEISKAAVTTPPDKLGMLEESEALFEEKFGMNWGDAVEKGLVVNASNAKAVLADVMGGEEMVSMLWGSNQAFKSIKLARGLYVTQVAGTYVVNGFYDAMREKYTSPGAAVTAFVVEFSEKTGCNWDTFRTKVIGETNPVRAFDGSLRQAIFDKWEDCGLPEQGSVADNGVHASAGPVEALRERLVWLGCSIDDDPMGKKLLDGGATKAIIEEWLDNPTEKVLGREGPLFDLTENQDTAEVVKIVVANLARPSYTGGQ
mmetsp:Transcript_23057/g.71861  ORF Transcript_23057/g.71861 Transcript_23057/m.71861 type:complete len:401 (+) Transcript_23057:105-1307(+)|eukprot:CAMPEP_0182867202 /NCGR_PEP_ID=MMETSP0034_2-20130328/8594_1 /TAXON_ID=156128 /ORGANISM="Nephroselmis pyriformis, Strain CCMP717" /LENGTH=400 /DNA_ID=CAMNT_0024999543 /DNA_START=97 /DNA_END=1299 /DNA_ORIENTATION=+